MIPFFRHRKDDNSPFFISSIEEKGRVRILRLKGDIGMSAAPEMMKFKKKVESRPDFQYKNILVDFKNVTHIDTAAIAELIAAISELKKTHHKLGVVNLSEGFRSELQILKVDKLVVEYPTESDAIKELVS